MGTQTLLETVNAFAAFRVLLLASEASHQPDNVAEDMPRTRQIDKTRFLQSSIEKQGDCEYAVHMSRVVELVAPRYTHNPGLGLVLNQSVGKATAASEDRCHSSQHRSTSAKEANTAEQASATQDGNLVRLRLRMPAARYRRDGGKALESAI